MFSSWSVVPQVIAALVSYEVERLMMRSRSGAFRNGKDAYQKHTPAAALQPLADGSDHEHEPVRSALPEPDSGAPGRPPGDLRGAGRLRGTAAARGCLGGGRGSRIRDSLAPLVEGRPTDGPADASWYWAAALLLDGASEDGWNRAWLGRPSIHEAWSGTDGRERSDGSLWAEHLDEARKVVADPSSLGRPPDDLVQVLARLAVGGPATCALRAFARVSQGSTDFTRSSARDGAARVAWGLRSFFNVPEVMALVRGRRSRTVPYWTMVVDYCVNGGLQAVLSEYVHILRESLGFLERDADRIVPELARVINEALSIRAATYSADDIDVAAVP